jgi:hypothetical protein
MKHRSYGKIKRHHRAMYHRHKSPARRFFEISGGIIAVAALIVVGYAAGKPLIEFLTAEKPAVSEDDLRWNPPEDDKNPDVSSPLLTDETGENNGNAAVAEETQPESNELSGIYIYAPTSVLSNKSSLMAYLNQAKKQGYRSVAVELKDEDGSLWYKSNYEPLKDSDIIKGGMTLAEIAAAFESVDMLPVARISTLMDKSAPNILGDVSYRFADDSYKWLDDFAENGGKLWADPFRQGTIGYLAYISGEIRSAGFTLVLANTVFPELSSYDKTILSPAIVNEGTRYSALEKVIQAVANTAGSETPFYIEVNLSDIAGISGLSAGFTRSAEVLKCSLPDNARIVAVFDRSAYGTELQTGTDQTVTLPSDAGELIATLMNLAQRALPGKQILPCIRHSSLSDNELTKVVQALSDMEYKSYIVG